jgi:hypothetical protein
MIEVNFIKYEKKNNRITYDYNFDSFDKLKRGRHMGLDVICDAIIDEKKEFILDL